MLRAPEELSRMMEAFAKAIRRSGVKLTSQRIEIFREAARTGEHPCIETVFKNVRRRLPTVSLDTVYRTMDLFRDLGLISTLRGLDGRVRFDANIQPHHHFICTRCGSALDLSGLKIDGLEAPKSAPGLGRVESVHVEFRGICRACAQRDAHHGNAGTRSHRIKNDRKKE